MDLVTKAAGTVMFRRYLKVAVLSLVSLLAFLLLLS